MKKYIIRKILSDNQYDWMIRNLPFRIMHVQKWVDNNHQVWIPRWGYSNKQILEAEKRADELSKNIKWD